MKKRFAMAVDTVRCVGCNACVIACKTENGLPEGGFRDWITTEVHGAFPDLSMQIRSERCNHCGDASCVEACPTGASHVAEGGIVAVARNKCTGCKACIAGCPYDARYLHPDGYVDKCTFCQHRLGRGLLPACVSTCPTMAMSFGDVDDPASGVVALLASGRRAEVLDPGTGARPNLYFLF